MGNFKIAELVPVDQLPDISFNSYHMCLPMLMFDDKEKTKRYTEFYKRMSSEGKYVIINNGSSEGWQFAGKSLFKMAEEIGAAEIVIPDLKNNISETLRKFYIWLDRYYFLPYNYMAVPQGLNFEEWKTCAYVMMKERRVNTIGITEHLVISECDDMIRCRAVGFLDMLAEELKRDDITYHLLGCEECPKIIDKIRKCSDKVRSMDTSFPYIATESGYMVNNKSERPKGKTDYINGCLLDRYPENARRFEAACGVSDNTI